MAKKKPAFDPEAYRIAQILYPKGSLHFIAAVMCMKPALAIMWVLSADEMLADQDIGVGTSIIMGGLVVLALLLAHPTFMLLRGRRWPRPFLRWLNGLCIFFLVLGALFHLSQGSYGYFYAALAGLAFALVSFKIYRSQTFSQFCDHYCFLWDAHRKKQRKQKAARGRRAQN